MRDLVSHTRRMVDGGKSAVRRLAFARATSDTGSWAASIALALAVGQISIRGATKTSVVLVEKSSSGTVFCISHTATASGYATVDAKSAGQCSGKAWPLIYRKQ